jgi:hypothetical protein
MAVGIYMDHHVPRAVTLGLRLRNIDVLTAFEDSASRFTDSDLLDRATALGRVLFTQDSDLLAEANRRQQSGKTFSGVIFAQQRSVSIGRCVHDLELLATAAEALELESQVIYLPL